MRARAFSALLALAACAHHLDGEGHDARYAHEDHPCDPSGARVARLPMLPPIETELFADERALRGRCTEERRTYDETSSLGDRTAKIRGEARNAPRCEGACEPMRASLPLIDDPAHDLEDETLQRECSAAAAKLDIAARAGCRQVCLVERRRLAAMMIFARVMDGLAAFTDAAGADGGTGERADEAVRAMWREMKLPLPPRRIRLATHASGDAMTAEGSLYPAGPPLRLRLVLGDAGCGHSQWTVLSW